MMSDAKAVLTAAAREALPDSAYACPEKRLYPHHFADGRLDLPHLRAALSRIGDPDNDQCGKGHLMAHRQEAGMAEGKAQDMDPIALDAWYAGTVGRAVRIIPFGGTIPSADGKGRDIDGEYFSERTDIKPHWFTERPVLWHHGADPTGVMGDAVLGKAINLRQEPDGWWEDLWLNAGESRLERVRRLEAKGAALYGSSTPLQTPGIRVKRARDGHIDVWAHAESTLSTSPNNRLAILRPAKAVLDDFVLARIDLLPVAKALAADLDALGAELAVNSDRGDPPAKAGRVLSAANEAALRAALEQIDAVLAKLGLPPLSENQT
jgi:hypothetical protein